MSTAVKSGELILVDTSNAVAVFEGGLDDVLSQIEKEVRSHAPDISTDKGRKAIASLAYKVAQSKTALDDMGKNLVAEWKAKSAAVDAERRRLRDRLDALKEEVRKPLTEWENAEKRRVAEHEETLRNIAEIGETHSRQWQTLAIESMRSSLSFVGSISRDWQEFATRADGVIGVALQQIGDAIDRRAKYDAEQEELARLRQEAAERAKREHEERIAKEAEERARREAELKAAKERQLVEMERRRAEEAAKAEKERLEREKQEAIERAERIERERVASELRAKKAAEQAAEAERQRVEREHEEAKRKEQEANAAAAKRKAVRDAITADIKEHAGVGHDYAEATMQAIVTGKIRFVRVVNV